MDREYGKKTKHKGSVTFSARASRKWASAWPQSPSMTLKVRVPLVVIWHSSRFTTLATPPPTATAPKTNKTKTKENRFSVHQPEQYSQNRLPKLRDSTKQDLRETR